MAEPMKLGIHAVPNTSPPTTEKIDTTGKDIVFLSVQQVPKERSENVAELKPKRGFVNPANYELDHFHVWDKRDDTTLVPVLVVPDPDREPTEEEVRAIAEAIGCTPFWTIARAAWRLGARVPS